MTKQELIDNMREMVKYILPDECREDKDIVENYTDTMTMIAEEYHQEQLKLLGIGNVSQQRELLIAFLEMNNWLSLEDEENAKGVVDCYLKAINCG